MSLVPCNECGGSVSEKARACPHCGNPMGPAGSTGKPGWGFEWRTQAEVLGWPLIHVAIGRNERTGKLRVAKGIVAVGQFAVGLVTIAQFGIGLLFGFGQLVGGIIAVGQVALGIYFGLGQFATGITVIGQLALGKYVLAQVGFGEHVWSTKVRDQEAVEYFHRLWNTIRGFLR